MAKGVEAEMRRLLEIVTNLPKMEYKHSAVLLYEMLAARNPEIAEVLAAEQMKTLFTASKPDDQEKHNTHDSGNA